MRFETATVTEARPLCADAVSLTLAPPPAFVADFRSGQHIGVRVVADGANVYRNYSICQPAFRRRIEIGARVIRGGLASSYLAALRAGDSLSIARARGAFYLRAPERAGECAILFVAGGSGITPIISMIEEALTTQPRARATLLYANRALSSTMFVDRLGQIKNRFMTRFDSHFFSTRELQQTAWRARRVDAETLDYLNRRGIIPLAAYDAAYLCGPPPMMDSCGEFLRPFIAAIYSERFVGAARRGAAATTDSDASGARMQVTIGGVSRAFDFRAGDESILAAAKRCGIDLPFSCADGVCGTCRAKILSGKAIMRKNYALDEDDIAQGFVLACQAKPAGDVSLLFDY